MESRWLWVMVVYFCFFLQSIVFQIIAFLSKGNLTPKLTLSTRVNTAWNVTSRKFVIHFFGCFIIKTPDVLTTGTGCPIDTKTSTMTVGPRGPVLLQDVQFLDEMSHFDRERIPERVVHAKGGGAFGYFEVTHDISKYCKAAIFNRIGKRTPCVVRFSTVGKQNVNC